MRSLSRKEQLNILSEAWDLVSKANFLLGQAGLEPLIYDVQKDVLSTLNKINGASNALASMKP
jgi:hypothetical protein